MRDNLWVGVRSLVLALPVARKREAVLTCGLLVVGGLVEIISLGAVFPFLSVLTNVDRARTMPLLG